MTESARAYSVRVDSALFRVRWALWVLVVPIVWLDSGGAPFPETLWLWLALVAAINLGIGVTLKFFRRFATDVSSWSLFFDVLAFGILPYLVTSHYYLIALPLLFPTLVGAIRFGPQVGLSIAVVLAFFLGIHALTLPGIAGRREALLTLAPIATLLTVAAIAGFLAEPEKESLVRRTNLELEELRRSIAGAKLLYQTAAALSLTTNYTPVLKTMLEAGVRGMPSARREDGSPVGLALLFEGAEHEDRLRVVASLNLDRRDEFIHLTGKSGVIAETLRAGSEILFDQLTHDPDLGSVMSFAHCRGGVCIPLQAGLEQYGVVLIAGPAPRRPSPDHLELLRAFANQASVAFQNARLYQQSRQEQDRIIQSDNEMRQKLARDLHDGPTQKVAALVMQLDYIKRLLDRNPPEAKAEIENARATAQQAVKEIRTALFILRPLALESQGLSAALEQYAERLREVEKMNVRLDAGNVGVELPQNIAATVFAIVEEAVGNARKHAGKAPVAISIARQGNALIATVQDQGPGFDLNEIEKSYAGRASLGLQNMRDRAKLIDGNLTIDSAPGRGTRVTLIASLPQAQAPAPGK